MIITYSIFDGNPSSNAGPAWPEHEDRELECETVEAAVDEVRDILEIEAAGLNTADGYEVGQRLYALIWHDDGTETVTHTLSEDDLA